MSGQGSCQLVQLWINKILNLTQAQEIMFEFIWSRRSTDEIQIADDLSKTYELQLSAEGLEKLKPFLRKKKREPGNLSLHTPWTLAETLCLKSWSPRRVTQKGSTPLLLIHPEAQRSQMLRIRAVLETTQFKGIVGFRYTGSTDQIFRFKNRLSLGFLKCSRTNFLSEEKFFCRTSSYKFFILYWGGPKNGECSAGLPALLKITKYDSFGCK